MACIKRNAADSEHDQLSACSPFSAPVRMKGLWVIGLERSSFFENETRYDSSLHGGDDVWLYVEDAVRKKFDASNAVFTVEIIGRRAMCEGQWGHMGMSRGAVIADRMVSIRR